MLYNILSGSSTYSGEYTLEYLNGLCDFKTQALGKKIKHTQNLNRTLQSSYDLTTHTHMHKWRAGFKSRICSYTSDSR